MESLSHSFVKTSATQSYGRVEATAQEQSRQQLESFRMAFRTVDSLLNEIGNTVAELPPDLLTLRTESERMLRRYQVCHSEDEDELRGALAWLHYYGDATDLATINVVKESVCLAYPTSVSRIEGTIAAIIARLESPLGYRRPWRWVLVEGVVASCILSTACVSIAHSGFDRYQAVLAVGVAAGIASGLVLVAEGFVESRRLISRVCFVAASLLMFVETFGLLKRIGEVR